MCVFVCVCLCMHAPDDRGVLRRDEGENEREREREGEREGKREWEGLRETWRGAV